MRLRGREFHPLSLTAAAEAEEAFKFQDQMLFVESLKNRDDSNIFVYKAGHPGNDSSVLGPLL